MREFTAQLLDGRGSPQEYSAPFLFRPILTESVFYADTDRRSSQEICEEVYDGLVNHDGYPAGITVMEVI